jgi:hypothetical protein
MIRHLWNEQSAAEFTLLVGSAIMSNLLTAVTLVLRHRRTIHRTIDRDIRHVDSDVERDWRDARTYL